MGTRSTTQFYYKNEDESMEYIGGFYRQFDGYISGHGKELKEYLKNKKIIFGIRNETLETSFNGMDCCGAAVISHFKKEIGGIYLSTELNKQFYNYKIWNEKEQIFIEIEIEDEIVYCGPVDNMPEKD